MESKQGSDFSCPALACSHPFCPSLPLLAFLSWLLQGQDLGSDTQDLGEKSALSLTEQHAGKQSVRLCPEPGGPHACVAVQSTFFLTKSLQSDLISR